MNGYEQIEEQAGQASGYAEQSDDAPVIRGVPDTPQARAELVKEIEKNITGAKAHWENDFKRMKNNQRFTRGIQWEGQKTPDHSQYVANFTLRQIQQGVAAIYAKNPRFVAKRRPRMDFQVWDGSAQSLQKAMMTIQQLSMADQETQMAMQQAAVEAQMLLDDFENGKQHRAMLDKVARTLELVMTHSVDEVKPNFKKQAKQLVRRVKICGVGYIKLGYQRLFKTNPDVSAQLADFSHRVRQIEVMADDLAEGEMDEAGAEMEKLRIAIEELQKEEKVLIREGLVFDFPKAHSIIVDTACVQLNGFIGAGWIAQEFIFSKQKVKEIYNVDVGDQFTSYTVNGNKSKAARTDKSYCRVWEYYDIDSQLCYTLCEGYPDFLKAGSPDVKLEQFHPFFALTFNDVEDEETIYPPSDVELMRPMQIEYNRAREGMREHRIANRPAWVGAKGMFGEEDKEKMASHATFEFIELDALPVTSDVDIRTKLQAKPTAPIDPALYDTEFLFADTLRVTGSQEANLGGTSGASATEVAEASQSRVSSVQSNIDDLDELLTEIGREAGQILLRNMDAATVKRIAGEGAVWPEMDAESIVEELFLEVKAGSSGRPNKALKIANMERMMPYVLQLPGVSPEWLTRQVLGEMDDGIDLDDAVIAGLPSITSMNGQASAVAGNPQNNPNNQGERGRENTPAMTGNAPGSQPGYPT
jgi:hypothetical protein